MSNYLDYLTKKKTGYKTYEAYLQSDYWQSFSAAVRADKCYCCGSRKSLQVHHKTYERLGEELLIDLVTVCGRCHERIHITIKDEGIPLDGAHEVVALLFGGSKLRRFGEGITRDCEDWREMCNISQNEKPKNVEYFLIKYHLAWKNEMGNLLPTDEAIKRRLFKRGKPGRKGKWNKKRYLSLRRDTRRGRKWWKI